MIETDLDVYSHDRDFRRLAEQPDAFERPDETDDTRFYSVDRMVSHLDATALDTVERLTRELIVEETPEILDLMASVNSHLPDAVKTSRVVGLGLNENELAANPRLDERVIHDLNRDPRLPFADRSFDVVLNTVSIQYVVHPDPIFREVARVLRPGGLHLVVFSNRFFPPKAVNVWQLLTEHERIQLVIEYFERSRRFNLPEIFVSMGRPRPASDRHAGTGAPSDPIFAVWADRSGGAVADRVRPVPDDEVGLPDTETLKRRTGEIRETLACPYCQERLRLWAITDNPWSTWDHDLYLCANDACPYVVRGWTAMFMQGNAGVSYRLCWDPASDTVKPIPVPSLSVIKDSLRD